MSQHEPFRVYCNSASFGFSAWDIRLKLMELIEANVNVEHGTVVMSPAHAKAFLEAFQSAIRQYEEKFGEIDLSRIKDAPMPTPEESPATR